jgi:hypothetical protein
MRIASGTVLGLAAVVSSPALYQAYTGGLPLDLALTRYLIAVVLVWAALAAVAALVGSTPVPLDEKKQPAAAPSASGGAADPDPEI